MSPIQATRPASSTLTTVDAPSWDVEDVTVSADGRVVVWSVNEDGWSVLYGHRDGKPMDNLPVPGGVIRAMDISSDGSVLALLIDTPVRPLAVAVADLRTSSEPVPDRRAAASPSHRRGSSPRVLPIPVRRRNADSRAGLPPARSRPASCRAAHPRQPRGPGSPLVQRAPAVPARQRHRDP